MPRVPADAQVPYSLLKWLLVNPLLHVIFRLRTEGAEHVPLKGPILLVSNHASFFDPVVLANCARRPIAFMAKEELFDLALLRPIMLAYGAFPVRRGTGDRGAIRAALAALDSGWAVGVFLNGTRTDDGRVETPQLGAAMISAKSQIPIVPVAIGGTGKILPKGSYWPKLFPLDVRFGPLIQPPATSDKALLQAVTQRCTEQIHTLLAKTPIPAPRE